MNTKLSQLQKIILLMIFETYNDTYAFNLSEGAEFENRPLMTRMGGGFGGRWVSGYQYTSAGPLVHWRAIQNRMVGRCDSTLSGIGVIPRNFSRQSMSRSMKRLEDRGLVDTFITIESPTGNRQPWAFPAAKMRDDETTTRKAKTQFVRLTLKGLTVTNELALNG